MVKVRMLIAVMLAVLVSVSAIGWVAAQDATDEPEGTPEVSQGTASAAGSGFLGVRLVAEEGGIVVAMVLPDSAAADADLQEGDVIIAVNGVEVSTPEDVTALISELAAGDKVELDIQRGDETLSLTATLGERPETVEIQIPHNRNGEGRRFNMPDMQLLPGIMQAFSIGNGRLGITVKTIDADVAEEYDLAVTDGALVVEVEADSPAEEAGLQADDVITAVNGEPVDAERTLRDRLFAYEPEDVVELTVLRGSETLTISVTLGEQVMPKGNFFAPFFNGEGFDGEFRYEIPIPGIGGQIKRQPDTTPNI